MKVDDKIIMSHYLSISYNILINRKIIHLFLFLIEIMMIISHISEIHYNHYILNHKKFNNNFKQITNFLQIIGNLPMLINIIIYAVIILIILINYYILNNYKLKKTKIVVIMINLSELFFYRLLSLFIFNYFFLFLNNICFILNNILAIIYVFILLSHFSYNHLYFFFPTSLIKYPYDYFSMIIDIHFLFIKILISISITTSNVYISQLTFYLSILILYILLFYLSYILINKSYYLMNNISLNKGRYSLLFISCILVIFILIIDEDKFLNIYYNICYANAFVIFIIFIYNIYDPYKFCKFDKDDNIENILYYLFILDKERNKYFLIEEKIENHISKCNRCNLCKKYNNYINGKNELDLYSIISNCNNQEYNLINKIVKGIKKNGKNSLSNNSYYLINIIYIYCLNFKNKNYCALLNTELLYDIINSENQFLEEYKLSLSNIKYANDFIIKANDIIQTIDLIFNDKNNYNKLKNFFQLGEKLQKLKYKESRINNIVNNIEDLPDCNNLLTICSIFYEELYNEPISNSGISIIDSPNLIEELINNNYKNSKQITLEINMQNFYAKIIRAGGLFHKYENNNFVNLFPSIIKNNQIKEMKNSLLNSNETVQINKSKNKSKKKDKEKQYINLNFIIEEKENNEIFYKLLKLKLSLILLTHINDKIYLNGMYALDNDIIFTEKRKNEEIVLYLGNKNYNKNDKNTDNIIKKVKNTRYYNGFKLIKDFGFFISNTKYNVYHILSSSVKDSFNEINTKRREKSFKNISEVAKENSQEKSKKLFIINDMASQASSITSSISKNNLISNNKGNKQKNDDYIKTEFKVIKYIFFIFAFSILISLIIQNFVLTDLHKNLSNKVDLYFSFKDYITTYNDLFFSILSLSCLADSSKSTSCINYMKKLNDLLANNKSINETTNLLNAKLIDFKKLIFGQNELLLEMLNSKLSKLLVYMSNDKLNINSNIFHYKINQNITNNLIKLSLSQENINFNDFILLITSRFRILTTNFDEVSQPIYILNKTGEEVFNNLFITEKLTTYQENIYLMILDFKSFGQQFDLMSTDIYENIINIKSKGKKLINNVNIINFIFLIIYILILISFITLYYIIILKIIKNISKNSRERIGKTTIKEIMQKKINNLKLLLKFYENDINKTINNLNKIYDDYKENYNLKIKEEWKLFKRYEAKEIKSNQNENLLNSIKLIRRLKLFELSGKKHIYFYSTIFIIIISLILYFSILIIWYLYFKKDKILVEWLPLTNDASLDTSKLMTTLLMMIYNNQTLNEISLTFKTKDYISYIYTKLTNIYQADKYQDIIISITKFGEKNIVSFDCTDFYNNLNNKLFSSLLNKFKDEQEELNNTINSFCRMSKSMDFENYKTVYLQLFSLIKLSMINFNNFEYNDIIEFIDKYEIYKIEIMYLLTYAYWLDFLNQNIELSMMTMANKMKADVHISLFIVLLLVIILASLTFFIYIRNVKKDCKNFIHIIKLFRVYNSNE